MEVDFTSKIIAANENKTLNKPFRTPKGPKKFSVYVKNEKGNIVKVNFGDPNMEIKRDDPDRRRNFRARHNCDNPGPKTKARYWSCKQWRAGKKVEASELGWNVEYEWDGETLFDHDELLEINPSLAFVEEEINDPDEEDDCGCGSGCGCDEGESDASLWENIRKKKKRIKSGSGEKMRKKGDKGAPTPEQMKKAQASLYEMTKEEFDSVMDLEDILTAARPGPKSSAQTPAKPSERKKGSSKNKPGSAGSKGGKITFSESIINSLKEKVKEHNAKHSKKVTLGQLKTVFRRGQAAWLTGSRPRIGMQQWAMARVNSYLRGSRKHDTDLRRKKKK